MRRFTQQQKQYNHHHQNRPLPPRPKQQQQQPSDKQTSISSKSNGNGSSSGVKRNILNNAAYSIFTSNETRNNAGPNGTTTTSSIRRVNYGSNSGGGGTTKTTTTTTTSSSSSSSFLQRSVSADNVQVVRQRGFKPSDRHDPAKRNFLESLTSKILHFDMESGNTTPINLQKLLTPASDSAETLQVKNKKMYASSYFYAPSHPTVEDQVELARRISNSLSDIKNVKSKGQSMYVNRKKRSVKWIHDGNGQEEEEEPSSPKHKDKIPLKCMMNPSGRVLDIHGIQAQLGEEVNMQTMPEHPEKLFDIVRDLNNQKGRGAEIFAKRRKRSEKWVVDHSEQPQSPGNNYNFGKTPPIYPMKQDSGANENSKFESKPFYNPFADLQSSMDYSTPPVSTLSQQQGCAYPHQHPPCSFGSDFGPCHTEIKKIYLREVAVGTEPDFKNGTKSTTVPAQISTIPHEKATPRRQRANGRSNGRKHQSNGHHHQPYPAKSNGYHGYYHVNGFSYHNGHGLQHSQSLSNGSSYYNHQSNGNGYHHGNRHRHQNGNGYHQNGNGYQHSKQSNGKNSSNNHEEEDDDDDDDEDEDEVENPEEDYTPVPVKQLIQEFEKTCRPVMQYKQYSPKAVVPENNISRFFESRREVVYHNRRNSINNNNSNNNSSNHHQRNHHHHRRTNHQQQQQQQQQYRGDNGCFGSSADEENDDDEEDEVDEEDEDEDDEESLDDSLSPVEFYRIDDRRLYSSNRTVTTNGGNSNNNPSKSSSMTTLDEYYRRQLLQQCPLLPGTIEDAGGERKNGMMDVPAPGIDLTEEDILAAKKHLKTTTVLENLVAGTTTPECFKKEFVEEVAGKLYDGKYHGPKINSYQNLKNYNTAPRGWDNAQPVYRPVKFEKPQDTKISYSDF